MDNNIKIIYRELEDRFVKICWSHKVQEIQAGLYLKKSNKQKWYMAIANGITTTAAFATAVTNGCKLVGAEWVGPAITSVIGVFSSIITLRFKDGVLEDKALACKQYAAKYRNIRNKYEAILADAKAGRYTIDQLCSKRDEVAELEDALFSGEIAPHTTPKAVELAKKSLIQDRDTQTEEHEIKAIVPTHLQEL
jgi:hypothetical protein